MAHGGTSAEFDLAAERGGWAYVFLISLPIGYAAWLLAPVQPVVTFMLVFVIVSLYVMQGIRWFCLPDRHGIRPNREYAR